MLIERPKDPNKVKAGQARQRQLREQLGERVRVVDLPHAGHFMVLEQPEAVAGAVLEFLGVGAVGGYPHLISRGTIIPNEGWLDD